MKVCWQGFLGKNHSWSIVAQNISRELIKEGHEVDLFSTNGDQYFPEDLRGNLKYHVNLDSLKDNDRIKLFQETLPKVLKTNYDMQLSYTAFPNFQNYFRRGNKNRFGIWSYETTVIPKSFAKQHLNVDLILPPSQFAKQIFVDNGIPEEKMKVMPHGIHQERFETLGKYPLKTKKSRKILVNIAQPHVRKNIGNLLKVYGQAFTNKDDICLVLKIAPKTNVNKFEVDFNMLLADFKSKFKNHGEIELITNFLVDIEPLYNACDIVFTMTRAECFSMTNLEAFAAKKLAIAPNYGGQLDFMNEGNSLLIPGKVGFAGYEMQYWEPSPYAKAFNPDLAAATDLLKYAVNNYDLLINKFKPNIERILPDYSWNKITKDIVNLSS